MMMINDKKTCCSIGGAAILTLCLILTPPLMAATVNIDLNSTNQTIRGFGGMNFPRWGHGLQNDAQVDTAFGNGSGQIGFTIMRIDVPPDSGDWSGAVAAAQRAINNHGAIVLASPWSPPASMKTNGSLIQGELRTDAYDDFADYLTDFANYMSSNEAPLYAISIQNEPDWLPDYESCGYSPTQMRTFLDNNASVIPVKVLASETVHYKSDYYNALSTASELDIYGDHLYGGTATSVSKEHWMTEYLVLDTNYPAVLETGMDIHDCMANNYSAFIWWYIRRYYGPMDEDGSVTKRGYVMSHFAKFVRPGYIRVDATENPSSDVYVTSYKDGSTLVIVAINQDSSSSSVTFSLSGGSVDSYTKYETTSSNNVSNMGSVGSTDTLAANSINTYVGTIGSSDTTPPTPDPMEWATSGEPAATGPTSITMTAETATDDSLPVQYYFECTTDSDANSTWQTSTTYVAQGLNPDTEYTFKVKARDGSVNQNETDWSEPAWATTEPPDVTPPDPDPMEWASPPTATGSSTITMTAVTASDVSTPVSYFFECTNYSDANSGWQQETTYIAQGLSPNTQYTFKVKARDNSSNHNETGWSEPNWATTEPPSTDVEILGDWGTGLSHTKESGTNRALIFVAHVEDDDGVLNPTDVTYGGQSMTKVIDDQIESGENWRAYVVAYILNEAGIALADNNDFIVDWGSNPPDYGAYASVFLKNVDQTDLTGDSDSNVTSSSDDLTTDALTTDDGDMVIDAATCGNAGSSYILHSGFMEGEQQAFGSTATGVTGYKSATGVNETPSVTYNGANRQVILGFVVQNAPAGDIPPAAPTGLVASEGNETVGLDWNDNSEPDLAGYNVYRSTTSGGGPGGYDKLNGPLVTLSEYTDDTVTNGIPYFYVVTAVDTNDLESSYSNEDSATPDYQSCADVLAGGYGLLSDLDGDCYVNYVDLEIITYYWLDTNCSASGDCEGADFEPDGDVDLADFSTFGLEWMLCNNPQDESCTPNW
jgi:glucuronoarabinoxylan endo-1,4-beta-xylanase